MKLIFDTVITSRKYPNLIKNPAVAFVIGWDTQTIQYEVVARVANQEELNEFLPLYFFVFPDGVERKENWKDITYFVVEPKWSVFQILMSRLG